MDIEYAMIENSWENRKLVISLSSRANFVVQALTPTHNVSGQCITQGRHL